MIHLIRSMLCRFGFHKTKEKDWINMWEYDGYSSKFTTGQKNWCIRCGERLIRKNSHNV